MKKLLFTILFFFALLPLFSQSKITLDNAIKDFAFNLASELSKPQFSNIGSLAVISFETSRQELTDYFIEEMETELRKAGANVYGRNNIEPLIEELNFSLTRYVSRESAQRIGNFVGANAVVYGSISSSQENEYRMTLTSRVTETGQIVYQESYDLRMDSRLPGLLGITKNARLWTIGASIGSSFSRPLVIGTIHGTIAPFRYSFLELGVDVGFISRKIDESYYSISPFAHYAFFWPFDKGGMYAGAGVSYVFGTISTPSESEPIRIIAADFTAGVNILDFLDISYTLRTTFKSVTNKFSIGYVYRFK